MSDVTHTPGPWRVEEDTTLVWGHCDPNDITTCGMGFPVAEAKLRLPYWASSRFKLDQDIAEANARLIAAAPELLEACLAMVEWDNAEKSGPDYGGMTRDTHPQGEAIWREWWDEQLRLCAHAFDHARAAIAKATGRTA